MFSLFDSTNVVKSTLYDNQHLLKVTIDPVDFIKLYDRQGHRCAITNYPLNLKYEIVHDDSRSMSYDTLYNTKFIKVTMVERKPEPEYDEQTGQFKPPLTTGIGVLSRRDLVHGSKDYLRITESYEDYDIVFDDRLVLFPCAFTIYNNQYIRRYKKDLLGKLYSRPSTMHAVYCDIIEAFEKDDKLRYFCNFSLENNVLICNHIIFDNRACVEKEIFKIALYDNGDLNLKFYYTVLPKLGSHKIGRMQRSYQSELVCAESILDRSYSLYENFDITNYIINLTHRYCNDSLLMMMNKLMLLY